MTIFGRYQILDEPDFSENFILRHFGISLIHLSQENTLSGQKNFERFRKIPKTRINEQNVQIKGTSRRCVNMTNKIYF